jgi:hypothetical protein
LVRFSNPSLKWAWIAEQKLEMQMGDYWEMHAGIEKVVGISQEA